MDVNSKEYDEKVLEMRKYIPILAQMIAKFETNQDGRGEGKEPQLSKMRMLHQLLTKNEKKLKLHTLLKCEAVLQKIGRKLNKDSIGNFDDKKSHDSFNMDDLAAPASPQEQDIFSHSHSPIVIPTERRTSPSKGEYRQRTENDQKSRQTEKPDCSDKNQNELNSELFRRRSPTTRWDRPPKPSTSSEDRVYFRRSPVQSKDSYSDIYRNPDRPDKNIFDRRTKNKSPDLDKRKNKSVHEDSNLKSTSALEQIKAKLEPKRVPTPLSEVLRSPPLSANDIVDLLNESEESEEQKDMKAMNKLNEVRKKLHNEIINSKKKAHDSPVRHTQEPPIKSSNGPPVRLSQEALLKAVQEPSVKTITDPRLRTTHDASAKISLASSIKTLQGPPVKTAQEPPIKIVQELSAKTLLDPLAFKQRKNISPPSKHDQAPPRHFTPIQRPNLKQIIPNNNFESQSPTKDNHESQKSDSRDHSNQPSVDNLDNKQTPKDTRERKEDSTNVRLAYKYNPHPRKHVEPPKNIELPSTSQATNKPLLSPTSPGGNTVVVNKPTVNTLPGINLADPRLRNRSMNFMMPDNNCPSSNQMDMKMSNSAFVATDNRRPSTPHLIYPGYGGYNQKIPPQPVLPPNVPSPMSHQVNHHNALLPPLPVPPPSPNLLPHRPVTQNLNMMTPKMNHHPVGGSSTAYNKFQPAMNDQVERMKYMESKKHRNEPKTYGEYRQAKLAEQKLKEVPKSTEQNQSPTGQKTPVDTASSSLDKSYRTNNYKPETPSINCFKIPKLKKDELTDSNKSKQEDQKAAKKESPAEVEVKKDKTSKAEPHVSDDRKKEKISKEEHPVVEENKKERVPKAEIKKEKNIKIETMKDKSSKIESKDELPTGTQEGPAPKNEVEGKQKLKKEKHIKEEKPKTKTTEKPPEKEKLEEALEPSVVQSEDSSKDEQKVEENIEKVVESVEENDNEEQEFIENFKKYGRVRRPNFIVTSTTDSCEVSTQNILTGKRTRSSLSAQTERSTSKEKEKENVQNKRKSLPATISDTESVGKEITERASRSRARAKRGKRVTNVSQVKLNENVEKKQENCVVSSTTSASNEELHKEVADIKIEPKKEEGKEWLEGFLSNFTNPALNKKETVLNILEKVLDEDKLKQIKDILDNSHEEITPANEGKETSVQAPVEDEDKNSGIGPKTTETKEHHKKKKTELDRLNEDIRDMFISKGVLTATGKRMCTILTEEKKSDEHTVASKTPESLKGTPTTRKLTGKKPVKRMGRKGRKFSTGRKSRKQKKTPAIILEENYDSAEERNVNTPLIKEEEDTYDTYPPVLTPQVKKEKIRSYKPCPKSKRKFLFESDKESSDNESELIVEIELDALPKRSEEQAEIIEEEFEIIENEKFDVFDNISEHSSDKFVTSFRNTNEQWHSKSDAAKRCIICSFAGEKMGNHYIRSHPEIEFPIARLPPHALKSLKEGLSATNARKKGPNWQQQCLFCTTNLTLSHRDWRDHYSSHTGEYAYKCSKCDKRFDEGDSVGHHVNLQCPDGRVIYSAQFECDEFSISGHACDLCGYIQLNRDALLKHLKTEHNEFKEALTKITLMTCDAQSKEKRTKRKCSLNSKLDESQIEVFMPKQNDVNVDPNFINYMKDISFSAASTAGSVGPGKRKSLSIVDQLSERIKKSTDKAQDSDVVEVPLAKTMSDVVLIDDTDDESEKDCEPSKETETQMPTDPLEVVQDKSEKSGANTPLVSMADRLCQRFSAAKSPADMEQDSQCPSSLTISDTQIQRFTTTVEDEDQSGEAESVVYVIEMVDELIGKEDHVKEAEAIKLPRTATLSEMLTLRLMKDAEKLNDPEAKSTLTEDNEATPELTTSSNSNSLTTENSGVVKTPSKINTEVQSNSWVGMSLVERLSQRLKSTDGKGYDKESEPNSPQPETTSTRELPKERTNDESNHDADSSFEGELVIDESAISDEGIRAEDVRPTTAISSTNTQTEGTDGICEDQNVDEVQDDDNWEDIEVIGSEKTSKDDVEVATKKSKAKKNELILSAFSRLYKLTKTSDKKDKGKKNQKNGKKSPETTQNKLKEVESSDLSQTGSETPSSVSEPIPVVLEAPSENNEAVLPTLNISEEDLSPPKDLVDTINLDNVVDLSMPQNDLHDLSGLLDLPATEDSSNMVIVLSDEGDDTTEDTAIVNKLPVIESCVSLQPADKELSSTNTSTNPKDPSKDPQPLDDTMAKGSRGSPDMRRIDNMGFSKTTEGSVKYQCLVESCSFLYSEVPFGLESHFLNEHRGLPWKGYCYSCESQVCSDEIMTLSQEYKHMMDAHVNSNQNERKETGNTTPKPFIKVRNISDLLSNPEQEKSTSQNGDKGMVPEKLPDLEIAKQKILNNIPTASWMPPLKVTITSRTTEPFSAPSFEDGKTSVTSPSSELKISSVSSNVNQDFIHNSNVNSGGFLKIAEVVSLAKLPASKAGEEVCKQPPSQSTISKPVMKSQKLKVVPNKNPKSSGVSLLNLSVNQGGNEKDRKTTSELIQDMEPSKNAAKFLKPWRETASFKSQEVADELLTNQALFSFFKCMGYNCNFFTNSAELMRTHYNHHNEMAERNGTPFDSKLFQFRECPYCSYNRPKQFLVEHMGHAHGEDIYHCPYCFYRTCVAHSVVTHCDAHHKVLPKQVLVSGGKQKTLHKEIRNLAKLRSKNVRPIGCWDCNKDFYIIRNYSEHLQEHNPGKSTFTCWMCRAKVMKTCAEKHLTLMHGIAVYECIYCSYATNAMNQMREHISDLHPSHLSYMCVRVAPDKKCDTTEETLESSTVLANLAEPLGDIPLIKNPFTASDMNIKDPLVLCKMDGGSSKSKSTSSEKDALKVVCNIIRTENSEMAERFRAGNTELVERSRVENAKRIERFRIGNSQKLDTMKEVEVEDSSNSQTEPEVASRERMYVRILEAAKEMVEGTGFEPDELYKCIKCGTSYGTERDFAAHIQQHIRASDLEDLKCACRKYNIKNWSSYELHLRWHAVHHYFCFFCNHTGPTTNALCRHINDVHQKVGMVPIPLILGLKNKTKDFFVVAPANTKQTCINQFTERMVRTWERRKALNKKSFTPDEIDLLPRQAIFINEVHCQVCNYRTKVRTNMFRHLQFHKQEIKVATVDPVNPVPCLNSSERHFDKMLNLACSSNITKDGVKSATKEEPNLLEFIPAIRRYVCGVPNCTYLTISKNMLKWHLNALHLSEQTYVCPHCKVDVCKKSICIEKIFNHLKFHESRLHVCDACNYTHHKRFIVDRHINEKHPNQNCEVVTYTRLGTNTIKTNESSSVKTVINEEEKKELKWECGLCKIRKATSQQISFHVSRVHNVKHRYQCVHCDFGGLYINIIKHMAERHPTKVQEVKCMFYNVNDLTEKALVDHTTPIWRRDPARVKNIRGILMEDEEESKRNLRLDDDDHDDVSQITQTPKSSTSATTSRLTPINKTAENPVEVVETSKKDSGVKVNRNELIRRNSVKTYGKSSRQLRKMETKSDLNMNCKECAFFTTNPVDYENHVKNFNHDDLILATARFSFLCYFCTFSANSIYEVRHHWEEEHSNENGEEITKTPFWFRMVPQVCCGRCNYKHAIFSVLRHNATAHPGYPPALLNYNNNKMCGQCFYIYTDIDDLAKHYQEDHKQLMYSTFTVSNELLEKLMMQGYIQKLTAKKCLRCKCVLGDEEFDQHNATCEPNMPHLFEIVNDEVMYSCCQCKFVGDEETVIKHLSKHRFKYVYRCFACRAVHKFFDEFVEHLEKAHNTEPNQFTITRCINNKIKKLREMAVIFPNGLILKKSQLFGTKYGDLELITKAAKDEFSKYLKPGKRSLPDDKEAAQEGPPKSKIRLDDKSDVAKNIENDKRKDFQIISKGNEITKNELSDSSQDISKDISKKRPAPEKVDLSKIFTVMNFGGKQVPISCDRFAKLVKINVRVRIEKTNFSKYLTGSSTLKRRSRSPNRDASEPNKKPKIE